MNGTPSNRPSIEDLGGFQTWLNESASTNEDTRSRLMRHLPNAIRELTPRQQTCLHLYYYDRKNMKMIGAELGVDISTVSKTIARAEKALYRVLKYCL